MANDTDRTYGDDFCCNGFAAALLLKVGLILSGNELYKNPKSLPVKDREALLINNLSSISEGTS